MAEDKTPVDRTGMANPGDDFDRIETVDLQVEMRRNFIQRNAKDVRFLDI